ncbi:MAG: hypothetical protein AMJ53_08885 [Gammaproteobacteria bacterium SG8_11]|nr:MAG: hypothetical protein AMJ53_08885 [Gammaproteobacteria bacterium SG8_11]
MSEVKHIVARIISCIALVTSFTFFMGGLSAVLVARVCLIRRFSDTGGDFDITRTVYLFPLECFWNYWPFIIVIGFVLPIVTVIIERNMLLRLLPLVFFIVGIFIYAVVIFIAILIFLGG